MTTAERNNFSDANDVDRIMEIAQANDNPHELIHLVQDRIEAEHGIRLHPEVKRLGFASSA